MIGKGSPGYENLAVALSELSDKEIQQLDSLISQPVYRKFQKAMNSPSARDALAQGIYSSGYSAEDVIKRVLRNHGLKY
ncbi:hypothetical protein D3870_05435 [Noviherbaspirillum cavernae]|uniref:Regulatory protein RecX n=2 Tax=Noviherbaspirillum cavernae TaxID=2320862 RepID=A0A418WZ68_9BURK|nr:hypothetical protein D3870_05435 [Noviherbaspirillum cavernae]